MSKLATAFIFVMALNLLMALSQLSSIAINPDSNIYYNCNGTILDSFGNSCTSGVMNSNPEDITDMLPSSQTGSVGVSSSGIFTDIFNSIGGWFKSLPGISFIYSIASAPYNILKAMLPGAEFSNFVLLLSIFWYGISIFLLVAFMWWRD